MKNKRIVRPKILKTSSSSSSYRGKTDMNSIVKKRKREKNPSSPSQWSSIQGDMLEEISKHLNSRTEILHLRAVCSSWRSLVPIPPNNFMPGGSPLKLPFPISPNETIHPKRKGHFLLRESTIFCVEPLRRIYSARKATRNWFVKIEESESRKVILKDPFSNLTIKTSRVPKVLDVLDYRVREVGKEYHLELIETEECPRVRFNEMQCIVTKKIVVGQEKDGRFVVMAIQGNRKLGMWKMGEVRWEAIDKGVEGLRFKDIAFRKGRFYAVDSKGLIIAIDSSSLDITIVAPRIHKDCHPYCRLFSYLVKSRGDLFLVNKHNGVGFDLPHLKVYKLNEELCKWVSVYNLGDQAMFIVDGFSYSVSGRDFHGCKENSIYFMDDCFNGLTDDYCLFDFSKHTTQPLTSVLGYSKLFWPPPTWLKQSPT